MVVPIERVRAEVRTAVEGGADMEAAIHAAAVRLGVPVEAVVEALDRQEEAA